jgi:replicative DNA helicase
MSNLHNTEKAILGELIYEGDAHTKFTINPDWFSDALYREIFSSFANDDRAIPSVLADKFGESVIAGMVSVHFGRGALKGEINKIQDAHRSSQAIIALQEGIALIRGGQDVEDASELLAKAISDPSGKERTRSIGELMSDRFNEMDAIMKGEKEQNIYLKTGYDDFDNRIGGYAIGDMTVIGARPSVGKTAFSLRSAHWQALQGKNVLWFNMDSSEASIVDRIYASSGNIDLARLRSCTPNASDFSSMDRVMTETLETNLKIDTTPYLSINQMLSISRREHSKRKLDAIYVDYLQQLTGPGSEYERVTASSKACKNLANELGCAVIALVQLNRDIEGRAKNKPFLSDLRSSGQIEQDAYMVIFPHRPEVNAISDKEKQELSGKVELLVRKHKDGPTGELGNSLTFDHDKATFRNIDHGGYNDYS